jgi:hypothetical protein
MLCPRCGLDNRPGITACARCGLPYTPPQEAPPPPGAPQTAVPTLPAEPTAHVPPAETAGAPGTGEVPAGEHPAEGERPRWWTPGTDDPARTGGSDAAAPVDHGAHRSPDTGAPAADEPQTAVIPPARPGPQDVGWSGGGGAGQPGYPPAPGPAPYGGQPAAHPYGSYGGQIGQPYPTPAVGRSAPGASSAHSPDRLGLLAVLLLALGGLLGLGYAAWAFTARRGIFADFADGQTVTLDDARSSDRIDTIFLIVAGVVALAALVLWGARKAGGKTAGGGLEITGMVVATLGIIAVLIGLVLSGGVGDAGTTEEQGDQGVTATLVVGGGFTLLAIGLLVGLLTARRPRQESAGGW